MWVAGESQGGLGLGSGPFLTLFCLAEQTAVGRKRKRGEVRIEGTTRGTGALFSVAGWVAQTPEVQREPFFLFCAIRMGAAVVEWGPLYCETVQDPPSLNSLPLSSITKRPSLIHMYPSIHLQCQISWGDAVFCRYPGERADVQPEEEGPFIVSVARQKRFLLPLRRSL